MKIQKKLIKESVGNDFKSYNTYSPKKQNIIITESQLEKLLSQLNKK